MITFFRKIRRQMPEGNRIRKYLFYAFGEIILVMVGILLALQVNTWNEDRKDRRNEQILYENLNKSLEGDLENARLRMKGLAMAMEAQELSILNTADEVLRRAAGVVAGQAVEHGWG